MEGPGASVQSRSGGHKSSKLPSSSYYVGPVAPLAVAPLQVSAKKDDGQKLLMTSSGRKVPIQPSICGISSSLKSRPSLDKKTREIMLEHQRQLWLEQQQQPRHKLTFRQQQSLSNDGTQLPRQFKYSRLQPLGVVDSEVMNPEEVLGVLPVRLHNGHSPDARPQSCAVSRVTKSLSERNAAVIAKVKPRKRSYSAILSQELTGDELGEMLYVSRQHMALIPQDGEKTSEDFNLQDISKTLPAVIGKKTSSQKHKMAAKSLRRSNRPREPEQETKNSDDSNADRLPAIEPENQIINVKIAIASSFSEDDKPEENGAIRKPSPSRHNASSRRESSKSPQPLSPNIVSIGETLEPDKAVVRVRHHPSSGVKGRLSSGWSSPQPIQGLTGSPLHTSSSKGRKGTTKAGSKSEEDKEKTDAGTLHRASTPGMMVDINIADFLGNDSDPDNGDMQEPHPPDHQEKDTRTT